MEGRRSLGNKSIFKLSGEKAGSFGSAFFVYFSSIIINSKIISHCRIVGVINKPFYGGSTNSSRKKLETKTEGQPSFGFNNHQDFVGSS
jgi:hypothetical protein